MVPLPIGGILDHVAPLLKDSGSPLKKLFFFCFKKNKITLFKKNIKGTTVQSCRPVRERGTTS